MRSLLLLPLLLVLCHALSGQDVNRFRNFHGIKHPDANADFFEAEGYDIFIQSVDNGLDDKGMTKIRKKYAVKDGALTTDSVLVLKTLIKTEQQNGVTAHFTYYLLPETDKKTTVIGFIRPKTRDVALERAFVTSWRENKIPSFVYTKLDIDSIDFVGRTIKLGPVCQWMSPHNVQCPNFGQMNWAIFDDLKQAEAYRDTHLEMNKNKNLVNVKEEKWIPLKFEGQETKALRAKIKIQLPKLVMGGSNVLVVYYVTGAVRGKYVTCVLSHYTDDAGADKLPRLLREVLELVE